MMVSIAHMGSDLYVFLIAAQLTHMRGSCADACAELQHSLCWCAA